MNTNKLLVLLVWGLTINVYGQTQLKKWYIAGNSINMQSTSLQSTQLQAGLINTSSNGIYDQNGNIQFYINGNTVYDKNHIQQGVLHLNTSQGPTEIAIIPFINNNKCNNKYYIFYFAYSATLTGTALYCATVDLSNGFTFTDLAYDGPGNPLVAVESRSGTNRASLAVSNVTNGKRNLFMSTGGRIIRFELSAPNTSSNDRFVKNGIGQTYTVLNVNNLGNNSNECDLSPDGTKLAISCGYNSVPTYLICNINSQGNYSSHSTFTIPNISPGISLSGVEFNAEGTKLYVTTGYDNTNPSICGIYVRTLSTNTTSPMILGSGTYASSQIELGYNGLIYVAKNGLLRGIDPSTNTLTSSTINLGITSSSAYGDLLPDQIDGCNYDNFIDAIDFSSFSSLTPGTWTPTSNPINSSGSTLKIHQDLNFITAGTYTLNGMNFEFAKDKKIVVGSGVTLNILGGSYKGVDCATMWEGFTINAGGKLYINNGSTAAKTYIEDALVGIRSTSNTIELKVFNAEFDGNEKHIVLDNCPAYPGVQIDGNRFVHSKYLKDQNYGVGIQGLKRGKTSVSISNMSGNNPVVINNCIFLRGQQGVGVYKAPVSVTECTFQTMKDDIGVGVVANQLKSGKLIKIENSNFFSVEQAFLAIYCNNEIQFTGNTVHNTNNSAVEISYCAGSTITIIDNNMKFCNKNAILLVNNAGTTIANIAENTIAGFGRLADYTSVGIAVIETGKTKGNSYNVPLGVSPPQALLISGNDMTNISYGIKINGVTGGQLNKPTMIVQSNIQSNTINYYSTTTTNRSLSDYNTGSQILYSNGIAFTDNTIEAGVAGQNKSWRNRGVQVEWTPNTLIRENTIKAGRGISAINEASGNNYTCNIFTESYDAVSLGDHWMRGAGDVHGIAGKESRENAFNSSIHTDIELYTVTPAKMPTWIATNQWLFTTPKTVGPKITYDPSGSFNIHAGIEANICDNLPEDTLIVTPPFSDSPIFDENIDEVNYWQWLYEYEKQQILDSNNNNNNFSMLIQIQELISQTSFDDAKELLDQYEPSNTIEQNFQTVYTILLEYEMDEHRKLEVGEIATLTDIAVQFPQQAGPSVYVARAILWIKEGIDFNTDADKNTPIIVKVNFEECMETLPIGELTIQIVDADGYTYPQEYWGIDSLGNIFIIPAFFENNELISTEMPFGVWVNYNGIDYITDLYTAEDWQTADMQILDICSYGKKGAIIPAKKTRGTNVEKESPALQDIAIYPNPASGNINITGLEEEETYYITAVDIFGKKVLDIVSTKNIIDFSTKPNGMYYIRISNTRGDVLHQQSILVNH